MSRAVTRVGFLLFVVAACVGTTQAAVSDKFLVKWVNQRVSSLRPRASDKPFEQIGWADDLRQALRMAKDHHRPIFLFTHDGRINTGRC